MHVIDSLTSDEIAQFQSSSVTGRMASCGNASILRNPLLADCIGGEHSVIDRSQIGISSSFLEEAGTATFLEGSPSSLLRTPAVIPRHRWLEHQGVLRGEPYQGTLGPVLIIMVFCFVFLSLFICYISVRALSLRQTVNFI